MRVAASSRGSTPDSRPWGVPEGPESSPTAPSPAVEPSTPRLPEVEPELVPVEPGPARRRTLRKVWNHVDVGGRGDLRNSGLEVTS
jgi:hypothetical protein